MSPNPHLIASLADRRPALWIWSKSYLSVVAMLMLVSSCLVPDGDADGNRLRAVECLGVFEPDCSAAATAALDAAGIEEFRQVHVQTLDPDDRLRRAEVVIEQLDGRTVVAIMRRGAGGTFELESIEEL